MSAVHNLDDVAVARVKQTKLALVRASQDAVAARAGERRRGQDRPFVAQRAERPEPAEDEVPVPGAAPRAASRVQPLATGQPVAQVLGRVQQVPRLDARVRLEQGEGRARGDRYRALSVLRAEVGGHDAVQLALHAAAVAVVAVAGVVVVVVSGAVEVHVGHPAAEYTPGRGTRQ